MKTPLEKEAYDRGHAAAQAGDPFRNPHLRIEALALAFAEGFRDGVPPNERGEWWTLPHGADQIALRDQLELPS